MLMPTLAEPVERNVYRVTQAIAPFRGGAAVLPQQLIGAPLERMSEATALAARRIIVRCTCPCCICIGNVCFCC